MACAILATSPTQDIFFVSLFMVSLYRAHTHIEAHLHLFFGPSMVTMMVQCSTTMILYGFYYTKSVSGCLDWPDRAKRTCKCTLKCIEIQKKILNDTYNFFKSPKNVVFHSLYSSAVYIKCLIFVRHF